MSLGLDDLAQILRNEVFVQVSPSGLREDQRLSQDLGVDSLGFAELRAAVESRTGLRIEDEDFTPDNFDTVGSLLQYIAGRQR